MSATVTSPIVLITAGSASGALIAICTLLILLIYKEILLTSRQEWSISLSKALTIMIAPLLLVFVVTAVTQILKLLN